MDTLGAELIAHPTAAGGFARPFSEADAIKLMECVNAVRPKLWAGPDLPGPVL